MGTMGNTEYLAVWKQDPSFLETPICMLRSILACRVPLGCHRKVAAEERAYGL